LENENNWYLALSFNKNFPWYVNKQHLKLLERLGWKKKNPKGIVILKIPLLSNK
jgi:hypothetical protein